MKFGTRIYGVCPDALTQKAQKAEALGFESLWRGDHVLIPKEITSPYPYTDDGRPPFPLAGPALDVLTIHAFLAQATSTIRLATGVFILPLRDPAPVARTVQTLDVLSRGRAIFGVGVGWMRDEYELVGRNFKARGAIMDESIQVLKTLWSDADPRFEGEHYRVAGAPFEPKPPQRPHPPIVCGGESARALRRAASLCDGWYGHRPTPDEAAKTISLLRGLRAEHGRAQDPFEVTIRVRHDVTREDVKRFDEAGVDRLVLELGKFNDETALNDLDELSRFAERLIEHGS